MRLGPAAVGTLTNNLSLGKEGGKLENGEGSVEGDGGGREMFVVRLVWRAGTLPPISINWRFVRLRCRTGCRTRQFGLRTGSRKKRLRRRLACRIRVDV